MSGTTERDGRAEPSDTSTEDYDTRDAGSLNDVADATC
jgi:hypothetical protein